MSGWRRWLLGGGIAIGLLVVAFAVTLTAVHRTTTSPGTVVRVALNGPAVGLGTDAANVRRAKAESRRMLADLDAVLDRASSGTHRDSAAPVAALRREQTFFSPDDRRLARVGWWTVPLPPKALKAYLTAHRVGGHRAWGWNGGTDGHGAPTSAGAFDWPARGGLTTATLAVTIDRVAGGSAVRADTFVDPVHVRLPGTMVAGPVRSVDVSFRPYDGGHGPSHQVHVTDAVTVTTLVNAFDALTGSHIDDADHSCPGGLYPPYEVDLVFHGRDGTVAASALPASCIDATVVVSRNGVVLRPALDGEEDNGFATQVERIVGWKPHQLEVP